MTPACKAAAAVLLCLLLPLCESRAAGNDPPQLPSSSTGTWVLDPQQEANSGQMLGRVQELETQLNSLSSSNPALSLPTSTDSRPPHGLTLLKPRVKTLSETLNIPPPRNPSKLTPAEDVHRLRLNILGFYAAHQGLRCAIGLNQVYEEKSSEGVVARVAALKSLPLCPNFHPCAMRRAGDKDSAAVDDALLKSAGRGGESAMSVCFSGIADVVASELPTVPLNCRTWYDTSREERRRLVGPIYGAALPNSSAAAEEREALRELLQARPELACAHSVDFWPKGLLAFTVFRLRNVYVSGEAVVFNRSTVFRRLGCQDGVHRFLPTRFTAGKWRVKRVSSVVNLAYAQGRNFYHTLVETLPLLLYLAPLLSQSKNIPVLVRKTQARLYGSLLAPLTGVPLESLRRYEMSKMDLFHAAAVYQPMYQACGHPSKAMWTELRRHLLHPDGLPLFNPDWSKRHVTPLSDEEVGRAPEDWVAVVAKRPSKRRSLAQSHKIIEAVQRIVGAQRVVVFGGKMGILKARELFRKTRLFVAGHGAALANMVFMPKGASVLEIRPDKDLNACYHSLADACSLRYHLVFGKGSMNSVVNVSIKRVSEVVEEITRTF